LTTHWILEASIVLKFLAETVSKIDRPTDEERRWIEICNESRGEIGTLV